MKHTITILTAVLILLELCSSVLVAEPATAYQAEKVVTGWLKTNPEPLGMVLGQQVSNVETFTNETGMPIYYIVYLEPSGFVIVPADDLIEPIIGFVNGQTYDPSPDNPLGVLVTNDLNGRVAMVRDTQDIQETAVMEMAIRHQAKWKLMMNLGEELNGPVVLAGGLPFIDDVRVPPLVQSKWGQTTCCSDPNLACYNYYTPPFESNNPDNYPCGCVATAMAQLMRYHEYPTAGIGVNPFKITVNGTPEWVVTRGGDGAGGQYNWGLMEFEPDCSTTEPNRQAIGTLCYDAGVTVKMDYGPLPGGSSADLEDVNTALISIFMYSNAVYGDNGPANIGAALNDMVNPNLDYDHPVILGIYPGSTDGHAVICDGYGWQYIPLIPYGYWSLYHHLNMGWEGVQDAWYNFISDMPVGFSIVNGCVYNIFKSGAGEIVSGRVLDAFGNPASGFTVTAQRTAGETYNAVTNANGIYALAKIPSASTYNISITESGYDFTDKVVSTGTSGVGNPPNTSGNVWGVDFTPFEGAIFVDDDATGGNNGSNWTDAYKYLQDALAAASNGDMILVAAGTYRPDANLSYPEGTGNKDATFQLVSGVEIYGGFPSGGCNSWSERNFVNHETILSGDIGVPDVNTDNSYHVVTGSGTDATAVLDGFVITAGNASLLVNPDRMGGGMYNGNGSPTVSNCIFTENSASWYGAGMWNDGSSPTVTNCTFSDNSAPGGGGGMTNYNYSSPAVKNCTFSGHSVYENHIGGGMYNWSYCSPIVTNCTFNNNSAGKGGGMANKRYCNSEVTNCIFSGNSTIHNGGGIHNDDHSNTTMTNCTIFANTSNYGGGVSNFGNSSSIITNCILWGNIATGGLQIYNDATGSATVTYSDIEGDWPGTGNLDEDPLFVDPNGPDDIAGTEDDDLRLSPGSPCTDMGDNSVVLPNSVDIGNHPRLVDGNCDGIVTVDMGAYEFAFIYFGDLDGDCDIDFNDFAILAKYWLVSVE